MKGQKDQFSLPSDPSHLETLFEIIDSFLASSIFFQWKKRGRIFQGKFMLHSTGCISIKKLNKSENVAKVISVHKICKNLWWNRHLSLSSRIVLLIEATCLFITSCLSLNTMSDDWTKNVFQTFLLNIWQIEALSRKLPVKAKIQ